MKFLRNRRGLAALGVLAGVVGVTLFVVLPAVASNSGDTVLPASTAGIVPTDVPLGGNAVCGSLFPRAWTLQNVHEYDNPNPQTASNLPSGNGDSVTFTLTLSGTNQKQRLQVTSTNAAIIGMGIKGGNDTTAYDYLGRDHGSGLSPQRWVTGDGTLHAPAAKFTVDKSGLETPTQWYGVSELNACYRLVAPISGTVFADASGVDGVQVTIVDNTTGGQTTVQTQNGGAFSSSQPIGDSYTVCSASPGANYTQTAPTSGPSCPGGLTGYSLALASGGSPSNDFRFRAYRTISGQIYSDLNLNGTYDPNGTLTPQDQPLGPNWTVKLYDTTSGTPTQVGSGTSAADGTYSFKAPVVANDSYRLCEIPSNGGTWVQTEPRPGTNTTSCDDVTNALHWGATFTGANSDVSQNFGNAQGSACSSTTAFGSNDVLALMPAGANGGCLKPNTFAFANGSNNGTQYVGVAVGDPTQQSWAPVVEKVTFTDPLQANGTPAFTGLEYIAGSVTSLTPMQSCTVDAGQLLDPTNTADYGGANANTAFSDMYLNHNYTSLRSENGPPVLPNGQTACLISIDITGASGGTGTLVARVYSTADSAYQPR